HRCLVQLRGEAGGIEEGARELQAEDQRERQHYQQRLIAPGRIVRPQELEGDAVVDREIQSVAGRIQQVVEERPVAHDQEDKEVVQHQHQEAAVVNAIGELLAAQRADQRMRFVQREV